MNTIMNSLNWSVLVFLCLVWPVCLAASPADAEVFGTATASNDVWFKMEPYKPIYFIAAYDRKLPDQNPSLQNEEVQFQLSFKVPLLPLPCLDGQVAFGYTQVAYWQLFNGDHSSPFRETNYAPELMANFDNDTTAAGLEKIRTIVGFMHESNGRDVPDSRSWNRFYAEFLFDWPDFSMGIKPWYRMPEPAKQSPTDVRGDDNPDILRFMGHGELSALYRGKAFSLQATGRNNFRSGSSNKGALKIDVTFLRRENMALYFQAFDGYGESLIDYNRYNSRIGFGVLIGELP